MKNNETGEFELVLGNKQLLSGFFVVALLFGVAFAMGYIVGRNSAPSQKVKADSPAVVNPDSRPEPASPATAPPAAPADQAPAADAAPGDPPSSPADPTPQPAPQAAKDSPASTAPGPVHSADAGPIGVVDEPAPGTYWQAIATAQPQAEILAKAIRDKGLPASLTPGTKNLTRVIVGPYDDTVALGRAKSQLEAAGFHPVILKR